MDDHFLDVDQHGVLRIQGVIWLSLILLVRHWVWAFLTLFTAQYGGAAVTDALQASDGGTVWFVAAQLPVLLLIFAAGRRSPEAGLLIRSVWRHGAMLVGITVCLNLTLTAWNLNLSREWRLRPELLLICFSLLDLVIGWSLGFAKYAKQLFAEFPASVKAST